MAAAKSCGITMCVRWMPVMVLRGLTEWVNRVATVSVTSCGILSTGPETKRTSHNVLYDTLTPGAVKSQFAGLLLLFSPAGDLEGRRHHILCPTYHTEYEPLIVV